MCTELLPPDGYPTAVNKYISYHVSYLAPQQVFATRNGLLRYPVKTIQQKISWVLITFWVEGLAPLVRFRKIRDRISAPNFGYVDWSFRVFPHSLNASARIVTYSKPVPVLSASVPILCKDAMNQNIRYNKTYVSYNVLYWLQWDWRWDETM
jgi:hypothetical protein